MRRVKEHQLNSGAKAAWLLSLVVSVLMGVVVGVVLAFQYHRSAAAAAQAREAYVQQTSQTDALHHREDELLNLKNAAAATQMQQDLDLETLGQYLDDRREADGR